MDFALLRNRLLYSGLGYEEIASVLDEIRLGVASFHFANEPISDLTYYIVLTNMSGVKVFKTVKDCIVVDMLDRSYTLSRELIGLAEWNLRKVFKVNFNPDGYIVSEIYLLQLNQVLFNLRVPLIVKYAVGIETGNYALVLSVNYDYYRSMDYFNLKNCVLSTYLYKLRERGISEMFVRDPRFNIVSFSLE